jgi:PAB-dependent poly(A)-specific ribonuclease subunit 3
MAAHAPRHADQLEDELLTELENGRLVRLLCKFGFINERPECVLFLSAHPTSTLHVYCNTFTSHFTLYVVLTRAARSSLRTLTLMPPYPRRFDRDPRWSETGDRYIIKLFRDYVFHQVDEQGAPVVNMAHVLTCLNKVGGGGE